MKGVVELDRDTLCIKQKLGGSTVLRKVSDVSALTESGQSATEANEDI